MLWITEILEVHSFIILLFLRHGYLAMKKKSHSPPYRKHVGILEPRNRYNESPYRLLFRDRVTQCPVIQTSLNYSIATHGRSGPSKKTDYRHNATCPDIY